MSKTQLKLSLCLTLFFLALSLGVAPKAWAQTFSLTPATATKSAETEFSVDLGVDTAGKAVSAVDAKITFDSTVLQVVKVQKGTFFPEVTQNIYSGTLYVSGSFAEAGQSASGSGKLATVTLKGKGGGTSPFTFVCSTQTSDSNIFDTSATPKDIINCAGTKSGSYTILGSAVGLGGGSEEEVTPTPEPPVSGVTLPTVFFLAAGALLTILGLAFVF
jgi:hypothetical protein